MCLQDECGLKRSLRMPSGLEDAAEAMANNLAEEAAGEDLLEVHCI